MSYAVKEIFLTLQGEGGQAGRAAVFCRFAGCNLWSGREQDRASAVCSFSACGISSMTSTLLVHSGWMGAGTRMLAKVPPGAAAATR